MSTRTAPVRYESAFDEEALIREARHLRRRRWLIGVLIFGLGVGAIVGVTFGRSSPTPPRHPNAKAPVSKPTGGAQARSKPSRFAVAPYVMPGVFGLLSGTELWAANGLHLYVSHNGLEWSPTKIPGLSGDLASSLLAVTPAGEGTYAIAMIASRSFGTCGHFEAPGPSTPEYQTSAVAMTANNGQTWTRSVMPECGVVSDLSLANADDGFALTFPGGASSATPTLLDATTDGGRTWHVVGPAPRVDEVVFASAEVGLGISSVAQGRAVIQRTTDGGRTWSQVTLPVPSAYLADYVAVGMPTFFDGEDGVADILPESSANQTVKRLVIDVTSNGGRSWTTAESPVSMNIPSYGPTPSDGDGLIPWQLVPFSAVSTRTWVLLLGPTLYETTDGGTSWTKTVPKERWLAGSVATVALTSATRGWAFVNAQVFSTSDAGLVWKAISSPTAS